MNVHRGGTMHQFIPDLGLSPTLEHRKTEGKDARHPVRVQPGSVLAGAMGGAQVESNSAHKQAMATIGKGLNVVATAPDGVVEGVEDPTLPLWLGVQWHPERIHQEQAHGRLFKLLIQKASDRGQG